MVMILFCFILIVFTITVLYSNNNEDETQLPFSENLPCFQHYTECFVYYLI